MSLITEVSFSLRGAEFNHTADLLQTYQLDDLNNENPNDPVPFASFTIDKFESLQWYAGKISVSNSDNLFHWLEFAGRVAHTHHGIIEISWNNVIFEVDCHKNADNLSHHIDKLFTVFMQNHCRQIEVNDKVYSIYIPSSEQNYKDIIFSYSFCRRVEKLLLACGNLPNQQYLVADLGLEVKSANEIFDKLKAQNMRPLLTNALFNILE